jgi:AcrR family transcriptional regulator
MPKAFTEHEKELIGQRLLEQGYKQFSTYGLRKTSIEELAQAAGISKGAFYIFYPSKEALFMDVVEMAEERFRQEILASIDRPGPSPRARLFAVLQQAFALFRSMPLLQFLSGGDYDLLFRRVPAEQLQAHLAADRAFIEEFVTCCRQAGIPIQAGADEIVGLLYTVVLAMLHEDEFGPNSLDVPLDILLELVAAFCLGEVELQAPAAARASSVPEEG